MCSVFQWDLRLIQVSSEDSLIFSGFSPLINLLNRVCLYFRASLDRSLWIVRYINITIQYNWTSRQLFSTEISTRNMQQSEGFLKSSLLPGLFLKNLSTVSSNQPKSRNFTVYHHIWALTLRLQSLHIFQLRERSRRSHTVCAISGWVRAYWQPQNPNRNRLDPAPQDLLQITSQ